MAICLNRSTMLMKQSCSGSACLLAHLLQRRRQRPEAWSLGKISSKVLCSNASGDCLTKSVLLHKFRNSCPLKRKCQKPFSMYMRGNHKIWITEKFFLDWFLKCFVPELKQNLNQKHLEFKLLLILNMAPTDKNVIVNADLCVKVISTYPSTTPFLQPMHLGVYLTTWQLVRERHLKLLWK